LDILKGRAFDVIVMRHVLEHCIDPNRVLTKAAALLNAQGLLICEVPNNTAQGLRQSGAAWMMLDVPRHLHFFTGPTLVAFCRRAGLDVVSTSYAGYSRQFSNVGSPQNVVRGSA
jgi:predicted TPR repeat methyltransferase